MLKLKFPFGFLTLLALTVSLTALPSFNNNVIYAQPSTDTKHQIIMLFLGDYFGFSDIGTVELVYLNIS